MSDVEQRGVTFPMQMDGQGDFRNAEGPELLANDVGHLMAIIGPTASSPGELAWNTAIGTRLLALKHRHGWSDVVDAEAQMMVVDTIRKWEPRVRPGPSQVYIEDGPNGVTRRIVASFTVKLSGESGLAEVPLLGGAV
ncbi:MAG: hypothetical protein KKB59_18370 [Spirochaetes bacterium]|nr:hypothetical protein [Spirochaetota bacterium]